MRRKEIRKRGGGRRGNEKERREGGEETGREGRRQGSRFLFIQHYWWLIHLYPCCLLKCAFVHQIK